MTTMLDTFLELIHPARTRDVLLARMDETINGFRVEQNVLADAIAYREFVGRFVHRLEIQLGILPSGADLPEAVRWQRAARWLRQAYGPNGEVAAFEIQRTGAEGGFYGLLRRLALAATEERIDELVALHVDGFCQQLSASEYLAAGREYLHKYGHLLPADLQSGFATRVRLNLAGLLKTHHRLMTKTTRVGH